jgi:hypothetical protein
VVKVARVVGLKVKEKRIKIKIERNEGIYKLLKRIDDNLRY